MDPDANVREQKEITEKIARNEADADDLERLRDLKEALNEWRRRGGFPPKAGWM